MKHNKKRNTAFIYETLVREVTKCIVSQDNKRKQEILAILKENFVGETVLSRELALYRVLLETRNIQDKIAERILQETKIAHAQLNSSEIFDAQSRIIATINKTLGQHVWSNFVPNFKSLASVNAIFNTKTPVKSKVLFEQSIVDAMSAQIPLAEANVLKPLDNLTFSSFIGKFNDKYGALLGEQKELLNRYITSFADDGFELRVFLNEELGRLKELVSNQAEEASEPVISEKLSKVSAFLDEFQRREFSESDLNKILKTQELVQELSAND